MSTNKFNYFCDKPTKNTYRFQPDYKAVQILGQATIYLQKSALDQLGIKPDDGLIITIEKGSVNHAS
jgi:hypothetical protein